MLKRDRFNSLHCCIQARTLECRNSDVRSRNVKMYCTVVDVLVRCNCCSLGIRLTWRAHPHKGAAVTHDATVLGVRDPSTAQLVYPTLAVVTFEGVLMHRDDFVAYLTVSTTCNDLHREYHKKYTLGFWHAAYIIVRCGVLWLSWAEVLWSGLYYCLVICPRLKLASLLLGNEAWNAR